jgi:hypothetical protein
VLKKSDGTAAARKYIQILDTYSNKKEEQNF